MIKKIIECKGGIKVLYLIISVMYFTFHKISEAMLWTVSVIENKNTEKKQNRKQ